MSHRTVLLIGSGVAALALVLGAVFYFANDEPASVYPTFESTPAPVAYQTLADLAAALDAKGLPCTLEYQDMKAAGQESIKEFATCQLFDDPGKNVELWRFEDEVARDEWGAQFSSISLVITGPNWIVTPQDGERADVVRGAIGGELSGTAATG